MTEETKILNINEGKVEVTDQIPERNLTDEKKAELKEKSIHEVIGIMHRDFVVKLQKILTEGNYPLPVVIAVLDMVKFELMINSYLNATLADQQQKRIITPESKVPKGFKR